MRRVLLILIALALLAVGSLLAVGEVLSHPAHRHIGAPPPDLHATSVVIPTTGSETVAGWLVRAEPGRGAILLLHGVRSDRRQMANRARFLSKAGYSVLLIDLPAHGESTGEHITFGKHEAGGVRAALAYLHRELPNEKIGVIGVSLGAASFVLADASPTPDAVVLESMYPTITNAVEDRLAIRLGPLGRDLSPLLLWQLKLRLGTTPEQLRPVAAIHNLQAPVLIAAGAIDQHTPIAETKRIFAAANEPKSLWIVPGAAHVDLYSFSPRAYQERVLPFFAKYLQATSKAMGPPALSPNNSFKPNMLRSIKRRH
jgi:fermentation-respiration switch protein FrsA (DUF1100 family)